MTDIYRISIPKKDKIFADWMASQTNPSLSMRLLIRHFIDENGVEDVFNAFGMELVTKGRGRKAEIVYKVPTEPIVEVPATSAHGVGVKKPVTEADNSEPAYKVTAKSVDDGSAVTMSDSSDEKQKEVISEMDKMKGLING